MPVVSIEELKRAVVGGVVGAISIDTSIVERYQYGFESGVLATMSQFRRTDATAHLVLDVVLHEMRAHLSSKASLDRTQVKNTLKTLGNTWGIDKEQRVAALQDLFGEQSGEARTEERLQDFIHGSLATELACSDYVELQDVMSGYFQTQAPFGKKDAKKHEFPDAIALLALEGWAAKNGKAVIAVSCDDDWKQYCDGSDGVFFVDDLAQALSAFQANADDAAQLFRKNLAEGKIGGLDATIISEIERQSDKISIDFEAAANWYYDAELNQIFVSSDVPIAEQVSEFTVLEYEDDELVLQTSLVIKVTAEFVASFEHWDSIDREYMDFGSALVSNTESVDLDLVITVGFDNGVISVQHVELLPASITMNFGEIEPDWMSDGGNDAEDDGSGSGCL